ncbi:MAG TPA: lamin tail domain-containing protein [Verrucomicrobiales bacterium]|nr:lamin tail domain-containing protein [Verrucomicrobiales bacterium]
MVGNAGICGRIRSRPEIRPALLAIAGALWTAIPTPASVRISELTAATSERALRHSQTAPPTLGNLPRWQDDAYDDAHWDEGPGPFGAGYPSLGTVLAARHGDNPAGLYLRIHIEAEPALAASQESLELRIDYDTGFVLWINGQEVIRKNLGPPGMFVYRGQPAFNTHPAGQFEAYPLGPAKDWLREGENLICLQAQTSETGAKLKMAVELTVTGDEETVLIRPEDVFRFFQRPVEPAGGLFEPSAERPSFSDWIEVHNGGPEIVDLSDWRLSDRSDDLQAFVFPPNSLIAPNEVIIVLASGADAGGGSSAQAPFALSADGETVILTNRDGEIVDSVTYPPQDFFHSYGRAGSVGDWVYFREASPGRPNPAEGLTGWAGRPEANLPGGFHDGPVVVELTTATPEAHIRYTLNGSEPEETTGTLYSEPLVIEAGMSLALRARAFREGWIPSPVFTVTYLVGQPEAIRSLPAVCLTGDRERTLFKPQGVTALVPQHTRPARWVPMGPDDYNIPIMRGRSFEKPASLELRYPDGRDGAQRDVGLRIAGSGWSRPHYVLIGIDGPGPWSGLHYNKPSFSIFLRADHGWNRWGTDFFGTGNTFHNEIRLRAGNNDYSNPFVRDELARRLFGAMGQVSSRGILSTLFVNGEFKGYYNPTEILNETFFQNAYDSEELWDIIKLTGADEGDLERWTAFYSSIRSADLTNLEAYHQTTSDLDVTNFADYLILNAYAVVRDWPTNNFVLARERSATGKWRYCVWDAESSFGENPTSGVDFDLFPGVIRREDRLNRLSPQYGIPNLYTLLSASPEFRLTFADRLQKHLFNGGALTAGRVVREASLLIDEMSPIMRYVRNRGVADPFTPWAEARTPFLLRHCAAEGLWPALRAPGFSRDPGEAAPGEHLDLTTEDSAAEIYYTIDGTDPRALGGAVAGLLYEGVITLTEPVTVRARAFRDSEWSPLREGLFWIALPRTGLTGPSDPWRYQIGVEGSGAAWTGPGFEDSDWAEGDGIFTANLPPVSTAGWLSGTELHSAVAEPVYFRREFEHGGSEDPLRQLEMRCVVAGGAIFYLNGEEFFRLRMPAGPVDPETPATAGGAAPSVEGPFAAMPDSLRSGRNVLAVEVHPAAEAPGVLAFGLELTLAPPPVVITEIMYHPRDENEPGDGEQREFLELQNRGVVTADLSGWTFSDGITFTFPEGTLLEPGGVLVLVRNPEGFERAYPNAGWAGVYLGALNNAGERLALSDAYGNEIVVVEYDDGGEWPRASTDGGGWSLVYWKGPGLDPGGAAWWTPSATVGGSPGWIEPVAGAHTGPHWLRLHGLDDWASDAGSGGISQLLAYAFALDPHRSDHSVAVTLSTIEPAEGREIVLSTSWNLVAEDLIFTVETSLDLSEWTAVEDDAVRDVTESDGSASYWRRFTVPNPEPEAFYRLRVSLGVRRYGITRSADTPDRHGAASIPDQECPRQEFLHLRLDVTPNFNRRR